MRNNVSKIQADKIFDKLINILYSILGNYETCEINANLEPFNIQCNRVYVQMIGYNEIFQTNQFIEIGAILYGMIGLQGITQPKVKSLIFHCINLVDKAKKECSFNE